ncbi:hypothetical protein WJX79_001425 [Trebouxia sp. C0005]
MDWEGRLPLSTSRAGPFVSALTHVVLQLGQKPIPLQNSLYEESTAANSKRKSEFGDNEDYAKRIRPSSGNSKKGKNAKGINYVASLGKDGIIVYQGKNFGSATAFSIHCKRMQTPNKQGDDGWKSTLYEGQPLEIYRRKYFQDSGLDGDDVAQEEEAPQQQTQQPAPQPAVQQHQQQQQQQQQPQAPQQEPAETDHWVQCDRASPSQFLRTQYVQQTGPPLQRFAAFERRNRAPVVLRGRHSEDIMLLEEKKELVANSIRAFRCCIEAFAERYRDQRIDVIAGFEARGFIFGPPLALELDCAFVPLRKPGKLPGETIGASYDLEYGSDRIEMHTGHINKGQRVLLIDDLVATGGTLGAGIKLMQQVQAEIVEAACVIELPELKGRKKVTDAGAKLYVLIEKEGA